MKDAIEEFVTVIDNVPGRKFKSFAEDIRFDSVKHFPLDSINIVEGHKTKTIAVSSYQIIKGRIAADSIAKIKNIGNTIYFPLRKESIKLEQLNFRLKEGLESKGISLNYVVVFTIQDSLPKVIRNGTEKTLTDTIEAQSVYLPEKSNLQLLFKNPVQLVWKRSMNGILLSALFSLLIISCLFYLLSIIRLQKQNNEIKNDFVSNITHEFKTPIATASSALEALIKYNALVDTEKTQRYVLIAQENLIKLNHLADKILDTASMENSRLMLHLKAENIMLLLQKISLKYKTNEAAKTIRLVNASNELFADIDIFYFENAITNIIDNALKYGGNVIELKVTSTAQNLIITIADNGAGIDKIHSSKIFEKFYRIPQGNVHNVKGFGIGLYHSKKIIESHGGNLNLISNHPAIFEICLPNA
ncbi:MAG: HAMP domain-containing histidine kinase [Chitinophagaceae bacterium]|nr:HAMP domain-containing histidine kinase [Chitinophagaceae bacterium]